MAKDPEPASFELATPVVFFVFNRPELTRRVFAQIRAARPPRLFVVADGPRANRPGEAELCEHVRRLIVENVDWSCDVRTDFAERNLGCGLRIFSGLQWAFAETEEAIILEDDCLPDPTFFRFCQEMLARHRDDPAVYMVSGTNFCGASPEGADRYFFSRHCSVWGWAGWRRALSGYSLDLSWWRTQVQPADLRGDCASWREHRFICELLDGLKFGQVDTWDIQWFAHVFRRGGFSVVPGTNLISNLGIDGTHTTGRRQNHQLSSSAVRFPLRAPEKKERNRDYERFLVDSHRPFGGWIFNHFAVRALRSPAGPLLRRGWHWLKRLRSAGGRQST